MSNSIVNSSKVLQLASTAAPPQDGASNQQPMETDQTCVMIQKRIKHDPKTDTPPSLPHISYSAVHARTGDDLRITTTICLLCAPLQLRCSFDATSMRAPLQLSMQLRCNFDAPLTKLIGGPATLCPLKALAALPSAEGHSPWAATTRTLLRLRRASPAETQGRRSLKRGARDGARSEEPATEVEQPQVS